VVIVELVQVMLLWWKQYFGNCEPGGIDGTVVSIKIFVIVKMVHVMFLWWEAIL